MSWTISSGLHSRRSGLTFPLSRYRAKGTPANINLTAVDRSCCASTRPTINRASSLRMTRPIASPIHRRSMRAGIFYSASICGRALISAQPIDKSPLATCNPSRVLFLLPPLSLSFPAPSRSPPFFFLNAIQSTVAFQQSLIARKYLPTVSLYGNSLQVLFRLLFSTTAR